jgi:PIN like domain
MRTATENQRRAGHPLEPPGYLDSDKVDSELAEGPAGDYLVWYQACQVSEERDLDLVVVTGDEKEDWWWRHRGDFLGPRPELVTELLRESGHRLFMLRPKDLLALSSVLEVAVSEASVADAERARPEYSSKPEWTAPAVHELLSRLDNEGRVQGEVIRVAAQMGGEVDRDAVYAICEFDDDRMLRGFTRPTARITADLRASGLVEEGVTAMLIPRYDGVKAAAFRIPSEVVKILTSQESNEGES